MVHALGAKEECSPFINFYLVMIFFANSIYHQMEHDFCRILCACLRLLLFYICFCSLLVNTCLIFIWYFVSVPLRKDHRGLEYQCSFVRLYLFLFAFLIIRIETFCIFDYLYWDFWFFVDFLQQKFQQKILNCRIVGAQISNLKFSNFETNTWFLKNNRALSKFL